SNTGADWAQSSVASPQTIGTYNPGLAIANTYTYSWTGSNLTNANTANPHANALGAGSHKYYVTVSNSGCATLDSITLTVVNCAATVDVTALIQGYYAGGGQMTPVMLNEALAGATAAQVDSVTIELHQASNFSIISDSYKAIIDTGGHVSGSMFVANIGQYYY